MESQDAIDELGGNDNLCIAAMFLSSLYCYNGVDPTSCVWNLRCYKDLSGIYPSSAVHFLGKFHLAIGIAACNVFRGELDHRPSSRSYAHGGPGAHSPRAESGYHGDVS